MRKKLSEAEAKAIREEPRFRGIKPLKCNTVNALFLSVQKEKKGYAEKILRSGMTGEYADALEREIARFTGARQAVAFDSGMTAMHAAVRLAAEKVYTVENDATGNFRKKQLNSQKVFCPDFGLADIVNPVIYEGGEPVFIDASYEDWGMEPEALEIAFRKYPDVKIVIMAHLYGFPGQVEKIKEICGQHEAVLIEYVCESFGASIHRKQAGTFGDYGVLDFHDYELFSEADGGILLVNSVSEAEKIQGITLEHRMNDISAGTIQAGMKFLDEYIAKKKAIYERYQESFIEDLMLLHEACEGAKPGYQTSCMTVESSIGFTEMRSEREYGYLSQHGTAAPMEILDALEAFVVHAKPVWKPMHLQPFYKEFDQITLDGSKRDYERKRHHPLFVRADESAEIFRKGICLPSDVRMTEEEQSRIVEIIFACYSKQELNREIWCMV